jgi:hypothetical protein
MEGIQTQNQTDCVPPQVPGFVTPTVTLQLAGLPTQFMAGVPIGPLLFRVFSGIPKAGATTPKPAIRTPRRNSPAFRVDYLLRKMREGADVKELRD